jgi:hypothetical protein
MKKKMEKNEVKGKTKLAITLVATDSSSSRELASHPFSRFSFAPSSRAKRRAPQARPSRAFSLAAAPIKDAKKRKQAQKAFPFAVVAGSFSPPP